MRNLSNKEAELDERVQRIARATDEFEGYKSAHAPRIAMLADELAQKFNLGSHDRHSLRQAALLHDIGEAVMNRDYIKTSRMLREDERLDMQRHTVIGEQETAKRGLSRAVQLLVRWHHEWWNGAGYPDALEHTQIPLAARILRVADTFCAMTDERPHRTSISEREAKRYLIEWAGIEFDPKVVKTFLALEVEKEQAARPIEEVEMSAYDYAAETPQKVEMPENIGLAEAAPTTENIEPADSIEIPDNTETAENIEAADNLETSENSEHSVSVSTQS